MPTIVTSENLAEFNQQRLEPAAAPVVAEVVESEQPEGSESSETKAPESSPKEPNHKLNVRFSELTEAKKAAEAKAAEEAANVQREREARVKAENETRELRNKYEPPKTEPDPEPQPEQFINTAEYGKALKEWTTEQANRERDQRESAAKVADTWKSREKEAKTEYADYAEITAASEVMVTDQMRDAIIDSEVGPKLTYFFAKNPDEASRLASLPTGRMLKELGKIEDKLGSKPAEKQEAKPKVSPISKAPEPESPLKGANSPGGPKLDSDGVFHGSYAEWKAGRKAGTIH